MPSKLAKIREALGNYITRRSFLTGRATTSGDMRRRRAAIEMTAVEEGLIIQAA